jgi:hypothetical protein
VVVGPAGVEEVVVEAEPPVVVVGPTWTVVVGPTWTVVVGPPGVEDEVVEPEPEVVVVEVGAQPASVKVSSSRVTAPVRARARPWTVTLLSTVTEAWARIVPTNTDPVPSVADEPTCQYTWQACAPLTSAMVLDDAVMSVESVWKMNTASALPPASRVKVPVSPRADLSGPL